MRRLLLLLGVALAVTAIPASAMAAGCSVTVEPVAFGTYQPLAGSPTDSTGRIMLACSNSLLATVALSRGTGGTSFTDRKMSSGTSHLGYQLYTNASHTSVWGDGTGGTTQVLMLAGTSHTIYGRLPAQQMVGGGAYGDTILVTVSY